MKLAACLATLLVLCLWSHAAALSTTSSRDVRDIEASKDGQATGFPDPVPQVGGDTFATAQPIPGLPYTDVGNTCGYTNDYDQSCPFGGGIAPDVVYSYVPAADGAIKVSLCNSTYDTKVYMYENGVEYACNDDACGSIPPNGDAYASRLTNVAVTAGKTYHIVVDGYGANCGDYVLEVSEYVPCITCPPGAFAEGEVDCYDAYDDNYNGGCNSVPSAFTNLPCDQNDAGLTVCGTTGAYIHDPVYTFRDTDWYHLDPQVNTGDVVWCVTSEYSILSGYLDATLGCDSPPVFIDAALTDPCDTACFNLPAGDLWLFVSASDWDIVNMPCAGLYVMTLDGADCPPISVEPVSWSRIKAQYR